MCCRSTPRWLKGKFGESLPPSTPCDGYQQRQVLRALVVYGGNERITGLARCQPRLHGVKALLHHGVGCRCLVKCATYLCRMRVSVIRCRVRSRACCAYDGYHGRDAGRDGGGYAAVFGHACLWALPAAGGHTVPACQVTHRNIRNGRFVGYSDEVVGHHRVVGHRRYRRYSCSTAVLVAMISLVR